MSNFAFQFRRSKEVYDLLDDAIKAVNDITDAYDGEVVVSRYSEDGAVKSMMAVCHIGEDDSYDWTFLLDEDLSDYYTKNEVDGKVAFIKTDLQTLEERLSNIEEELSTSIEYIDNTLDPKASELLTMTV